MLIMTSIISGNISFGIGDMNRTTLRTPPTILRSTVSDSQFTDSNADLKKSTQMFISFLRRTLEIMFMPMASPVLDWKRI